MIVDELRIVGSTQTNVVMAAELVERVRIVVSLLDGITAFVEPAKLAYREKLSQKLQEYRDVAQWDPERVAQEIVVFAERGDITEEVTRLRSHVSQFLTLVEAGGETGKKLDFLLQEMNREVNTMGSKADGLKVSELIIAAKAELEKMREQVQNAE